MKGRVFVHLRRRTKQVNYIRPSDLWFIPDDQDVSNFVDDHDTTSISALTASERGVIAFCLAWIGCTVVRCNSYLLSGKQAHGECAFLTVVGLGGICRSYLVSYVPWHYWTNGLGISSCLG